MNFILKRNGPNIVIGDNLVQMIEKKNDNNTISDRTKKLIKNEIKRLKQTNSAESLDMLDKGRLALENIKSDKIKQNLRKYFSSDVIQVNNIPMTMSDKRLGDGINFQRFETPVNLVSKPNELNSECFKTPSESELSNQYNLDCEFKSFVNNEKSNSLVSDGKKKELNQILMKIINEKHIENKKELLMEYRKYISVLNMNLDVKKSLCDIVDLYVQELESVNINNIEVRSSDLNNQFDTLDVEFQLRMILASDSSIDEIKECVISNLSSKGVSQNEIKKSINEIDKLNDKKGIDVVKDKLCGLLEKYSSNKKTSKNINDTFIEEIRYKHESIEFQDKATSITGLNDKEKWEVPIDLKNTINEAFDRNYLSKINLFNIKSLLRDAYKSGESVEYSAMKGYLEYGVPFSNDDINAKKLKKIIREVESPSIRRKVLDFFSDIKSKAIKWYNNIFSIA